MGVAGKEKGRGEKGEEGDQVGTNPIAIDDGHQRSRGRKKEQEKGNFRERRERFVKYMRFLDFFRVFFRELMAHPDFCGAHPDPRLI